jgi:hypothetical protein
MTLIGKKAKPFRRRFTLMGADRGGDRVIARDRVIG